MSSIQLPLYPSISFYHVIYTSMYPSTFLSYSSCICFFSSSISLSISSYFTSTCPLSCSLPFYSDIFPSLPNSSLAPSLSSIPSLLCSLFFSSSLSLNPFCSHLLAFVISLALTHTISLFSNPSLSLSKSLSPTSFPFLSHSHTISLIPSLNHSLTHLSLLLPLFPSLFSSSSLWLCSLFHSLSPISLSLSLFCSLSHFHCCPFSSFHMPSLFQFLSLLECPSCFLGPSIFLSLKITPYLSKFLSGLFSLNLFTFCFHHLFLSLLLSLSCFP